MNTAALYKWASPSGRVGRKGYWLHFMLPAFVLTLFVGLGLPLSLAPMWIFIVGNVKRVRDLKVSARRVVVVMGLLIGVMAVVAVAFSFFNLPGNFDLGVWMMIAAAVLIVAALLIVGFVGSAPGDIFKEGHAPQSAESASDLT